MQIVDCEEGFHNEAFDSGFRHDVPFLVFQIGIQVTSITIFINYTEFVRFTKRMFIPANIRMPNIFHDHAFLHFLTKFSRIAIRHLDLLHYSDLTVTPVSYFKSFAVSPFAQDLHDFIIFQTCILIFILSLHILYQ